MKQVQTYFSLATGLIVAGVLRVLFSGETYADLVVFELYTMGEATLLTVFAIPVLMSWQPTVAVAVNPVLVLCLHALAGAGFFGRNWRGWLIPPLAVVVAFTAMILISGIGGFVGAMLLAA